MCLLILLLKKIEDSEGLNNDIKERKTKRQVNTAVQEEESRLCQMLLRNKVK